MTSNIKHYYIWLCCEAESVIGPSHISNLLCPHWAFLMQSELIPSKL